jgi:hypothetical protein
VRFAFVTDELPVAGVAGHLAFNAAILDWLLAQGHEVVVLLVRPRFVLPVRRYRVVPVVGPGIVSWRNVLVSYRPGDVAAILARFKVGRLPASLAGMVRRRGRSGRYGAVDAVLGAFITPAQSEWCVKYLTGIQLDAVLIDTIFRAPLLADQRLAGYNSVLLAHDVFHLRHRALGSAGYQVHPAILTREIEASLLGSAHHIVAIQPEEAGEMRAMCPAYPVHIAAMPAVPCPRLAGTARLPSRLVFTGSDALPNLDGLRWFLAEIWPRLTAWRPDITLDLAGSCGAAMGRLPAGVNRLGQVRQLDKILHRASLAISPLRVGSGLKVKLLDYARHGLTTIATPVSLQGFARDAGAPFIAASDAVSFANAIAACLQDPHGQTREQNALNYVSRHYGIEQSFAGLTEALGLPVKLNAS